MREIADDHYRVELFEHLAAQCFRVRLVIVHLAAGEFPVAGEMRAFRPQGEEKRSVTLDDGGDDDNRFHRGADEPTGTGWIHASLPFDSMIFARTYPSSPLKVYVAGLAVVSLNTCPWRPMN